MLNLMPHNGKGIYAVVAFPVPSVLVKDIKPISKPKLATCTSATIA
jgi:hypothetical protein